MSPANLDSLLILGWLAVLCVFGAVYPAAVQWFEARRLRRDLAHQVDQVRRRRFQLHGSDSR